MSDPADNSAEPNPPRRRRWADLGPRLISAAVLISITVGSLYLGGFVFAAAVSAIFAGAYREWETMVSRAPLTSSGIGLIVLVALSGLAYPLFGPLGTIAIIAAACLVAVSMRGEGMWWRILGLCIYGAIILSTLMLRGQTHAGILASVFLGTVVWMTDSAAFFTVARSAAKSWRPIFRHPKPAPVPWAALLWAPHPGSSSGSSPPIPRGGSACLLPRVSACWGRWAISAKAPSNDIFASRTAVILSPAMAG